MLAVLALFKLPFFVFPSKHSESSLANQRTACVLERAPKVVTHYSVTDSATSRGKFNSQSSLV